MKKTFRYLFLLFPVFAFAQEARQGQFKMNAGQSVDNRQDSLVNQISVPFRSVAGANAATPKAWRHQGLVKQIIVNGQQRQYWYVGGREDSNLVMISNNSNNGNIKDTIVAGENQSFLNSDLVIINPEDMPDVPNAIATNGYVNAAAFQLKYFAVDSFNNTVAGREPGVTQNIDGKSNTDIAVDAGLMNQHGSFGTHIGVGAGRQNKGSYGTFIGNGSSANAIFTDMSTTVGAFSNGANISGGKQSAFGFSSLSASLDSFNVAMGIYAGTSLVHGIYNTFLGPLAGNSQISGSYNTMIGLGANVPNPSGNSQLSISNMIYGINLSQSLTNPTGTIGIGTSAPSISAVLHLVSTTQGFGLPTLTNTQRDLIASPIPGLQVYNTTTGMVNYYNGSIWVTQGLPDWNAATGSPYFIANKPVIKKYVSRDTSGILTLHTSANPNAPDSFSVDFNGDIVDLNGNNTHIATTHYADSLFNVVLTNVNLKGTGYALTLVDSGGVAHRSPLLYDSIATVLTVPRISLGGKTPISGFDVTARTATFNTLDITSYTPNTSLGNGYSPASWVYGMRNNPAAGGDGTGNFYFNYGGKEIVFKVDGSIVTPGDVEITDSTKGLILKDSGDGSRRRITVVNGVLIVSAAL